MVTFKKTASERLEEGDALYDAGLYEEAIECYDQAIKLEPENINTLILKSTVLARVRKFDGR
ncbi:TPR repeat-containing protein [Fervidobacterium changbaicum]|uniref:Tetratricopeptide repeat protein n=1 Tax=Fervidobacterium changbaicum TaxID=310769 RepID=A0ABX5QSY1_9BACT|nr:tetratricopeptide repeat protein [Fervidobacterium changbaicum]QAV33621.1 tetratricopeptide repeat protein [Fervidobacterium changbaicum]SDH72058.1 TPR repeat-containing protein [Fervidobacterium changbaicum]